MLASVAILGISSTAYAIDLNDKLSFENTFKTKYSVENSDFTSTYKGKLVYSVTDEVDVFAKGYVDLDETTFEKLRVGIEYHPKALQYIEIKGYVETDDSLQYSDAILEAQLKF